MEDNNISKSRYMVFLNDFEQVADCIYKDEKYSVRDNGAVLRHPRKDKRKRKYDNLWTFGKPNKNGYLLISTEVVHRIVAYAFIGEPPTIQHIVDHIDTNRQNNRPENLRWLTKLENTLNNPITLKKIEYLCGSIEAFLKDPSILENYINEDPNFDWMRTVTPKEAKASLERLSSWAKKENVMNSSIDGKLGEWIFKDNNNYPLPKKTPELVISLTPSAAQKNWHTPSEFPYCPQETTDKSIKLYVANLKVGEVFSSNKYASSIILDFAISEDEEKLWVMSKFSEDNAIKPWALAQITYENNLFIHENLGAFFEEIGAKKQFTLAQGLEWTGGDSIDDFS